MSEQEEPISERSEIAEEEQTPKKRIYRVIKTPRPETPLESEGEKSIPRKTKTVQIASPIKRKGPYEDPIPGSIEEDFLLEGRYDTTKFFSVDKLSEEQITRYDEKGNRISLEELEEAAELNEPPIISKQQSGRNLIHAFSQTSRGLTRLATQRSDALPIVDYEQLLNNKLQQIQEGKQREKEILKEQQQRLPPGVKIIMNKQKNILKKHREMTQYWEKMTRNIAEKIEVDVAEMAFHRSQMYRERIEEMDQLDRAETPDEKAGHNAWYMSLRNNKNSQAPREIYISAGNVFSGLFTKVKERSNEPEPIIRNPSAPISTKRTFRNSSYYQEKVDHFASNKSLRPVECCEVQDIIIFGSNKLALELAAAKSVGIEKIIYDSGEKLPEPDEVIAEHYDPINLY